GTVTFAKGNGLFKFLPATWINQFNTDRPAGFNDGPMIPARGYQTMYSRGIYFRYRHLSIQLQPEIVYAGNSNYEGFPHTLYDPVLADQRWYQYYNYDLNNIDLPERFGLKDFTKAFWGQSSIHLNYGAFSFGLSTENLWWGPGMYNSLLMTNNAPGFKHLTLNTIRPVKTPIGSFEGQLIAGKLESSGFPPPEADRRYFQTLLYVPKSDDWRYLNGLVVSYQPKWVPGLFLGLTRSFMVYSKDLGKGFDDYLPVLNPFGKKGNGGAAEDAKKRDQMASLFMRWVWLKSHGEVYLEYGRRDYFWNPRDLEVEASYSSAYVLGFKKLMPLKSFQDEYLSFNLELTQLEMNPTTRNRGGQSWYISDVVRDGYTNQGQLLGAGIGPGSNIQTVNVAWVKSFKKIGIEINRYLHNNDFFYTYVQEIRSHWIDFSEAVVANWDYRNLLFNARVESIQTMNYGWNFPMIYSPTYWVAGKDIYNYHFQLGITYRF
ncbi:MAG: capsule assembly Wzi family protein, partial [Bacteroidota bacterium]|nr:capsule assembly Wzi family protein [Bacteroidota bacterium]